MSSAPNAPQSRPEVLRLSLTQDGSGGNKRSVRLLGPNEDVLAIGSDRSSPILRLGVPQKPATQDRMDEVLSTCSAIFFVFHTSPTIAAHILQKEFHIELSDETLLAGLTLGRASVFLASQDELLTKVVQLLKDRMPVAFRGYEEWRLLNSHLEVTYPRVEPIEHRELNIDRSAAPNADFSTTASDALLCLSTILSHAKVFAPQNTPQFQTGADTIANFMRRAELLSQPDAEGNPNLMRELQGELTEFAASLSYVDSQWFSGTSRIIAHPGQIRDQSLLGAGTACSGLNNALLTANRFVKEAQIYSRFTSLLAAQNRFDGGDIKSWSNWARMNVKESHVPHIRVTEPTIPLVHFSARRGWRETEFSLSAPTSALRHGLSRIWHVRNISHEWLHSHVRILLDLLKRHVNLRVDEGLTSINPEGRTYRVKNAFSVPAIMSAGLPLTKDDDSDAIDGGLALWHLLCDVAYRASLMKSFLDRNLMFHGQLADLQLRAKQEFSVPGLYQQALQFATEEFNEIAVQILDLLYFYEGNKWDYLEGIWPAWSNIQVVHKRHGYYLRRLLSAMLATRKAPDIHEADSFRLKLIDHFESSNHQPTDLTEKALSVLRSSSWGEEERPKLAVRLPWIEAVRAFFFFESFSSRSQDDRFIDRRIVAGKPTSEYKLAPFQYPASAIQNPFVLLSAMQRTHNDDSLAASIWLYSHLASTDISDSGNSDDLI